ncbi:hypothetical protein FS935_16120 [Metabacillus litoralis]|uniref:Uncharacterized protein n=1 Tax=Metabacillus litoralis TaxID=152268 RepID=A0A5C6W0Q9_9BACI|nr:hypothetical protein [Metabacillus litoralis]TXC89880.1 hypothetical protein FS935_16120 [Metabacillus litoralis]
MEILPIRDLIQDELGNYYIVKAINGKKLTLVNAIIHHSFRRILSEDFVAEVNKQYDKGVAVGQYFTDALKSKIESISTGKTPGGIYKLSDIQKEYDIEVISLYEKDVNVN